MKLQNQFEYLSENVKEAQNKIRHVESQIHSGVFYAYVLCAQMYLYTFGLNIAPGRGEVRQLFQKHDAVQ